MNDNSSQIEGGRFHIHYRYIGFGNPLAAADGFRDGNQPVSEQLLFDNELAVDVGNACWHRNGETRRILDHHFEEDNIFPSASAAVLHNIGALSDWAVGLPPNQEVWLTTHYEPDFDAFCALNLAQWIVQGELRPQDFEGVFCPDNTGGARPQIDWFTPQLPGNISAAARTAMRLASYASHVDQGRPMHAPRSHRLHALLYAALKRDRPLREEGASSFFTEVRRRLDAGDLNPLFDSIFDLSEDPGPYTHELRLLRCEETAYQRDVRRSRRAYVQVYQAEERFEKWFEKRSDIPFFERRGAVDPRHLAFSPQKRVAVEGIFLRDPQSFLFKEWAREDTEHSRSGQGFVFTAVAYSKGFSHNPAGHQTRYIFALDPERAEGKHLYNLWARLQAAEFQVRGITECLEEPHRPDFAGRRAGSDPWFDGNSYRCTIVDTPYHGTALRAGSTSDLSDISTGTVESVLRQELEYAWYSPNQIEIWDFPAGAETNDGSLMGHGFYAIDQPAKLPELVPEYLRFGRISLDPETDTRDSRLAMQIGRDLWQILEDQDTSTLPSDFETHHLVPGAHSVVVWSRRGAAIAHRREKGAQQARLLQEAFERVAKVRQGLGRMLKGNGGISDERARDMAAQGERLQEGARLTETIIPLQLLASSPEGAALRRFFASTPFDSVLQSLHELNQGNLGLLHQQAIECAATSVNKNVQAITSMQTKVEYVEVFLVGMYSIYLIHYLGEAFHFGDVPYYVGCWIIGGTVFASTVAALLLQPWHQDKHTKTESPGPKPPGTTKSPLRKMFWISALAIAMLALYVRGGFWFKNHPVGSHDQSQKPEQSEPAVPPSKPSP